MNTLHPNPQLNTEAGSPPNQPPKDRLIVILGPTATGKSHCGIRLAQQLGGEIISGDSMLIYQKMNIGTAKPSPEELALVPHHLVDILPPEADFSVVEFKNRAQALIKEINAKGRLPILVGGTGLYVKALLEDYQFSQVGEDSQLRQQLTQLAEVEGSAALHARLAQLNPEAAARLHTNDTKRIIRAIEAAQGGEEISQQGAKEPVYDALVYGLNMERSLLYDRINRRVDIMLAQGLEQETRSLMEQGLRPDNLSMKSIGYRQMAQYFAGELDYTTMVDKLKQATRNFAKRQITWYKRMPYVHWFELDREPNYEAAIDTMYREAVAHFKIK